MTSNGLVLVHEHNGWSEIVLNRPERKNALIGPLADDLIDALEAVASNESTRVVTLAGAGGAFCSGLDLAEFGAEEPAPWVAEFSGLWDRVHELLFALSQPVITAVERFSINGGSALALAGDLCIVGESTFIEVSEARLGMAAPKNLFWLKQRHSESVIARLTLLGDRVPAPELLRLGLATEMVADDQVLTRARELATQLAAYPDGGLRSIKAGYRR